MKKVSVYVSDDGTRFNTEKECRLYEELCGKVKAVMSELRPRNIDYNIAVQQDKSAVANAYVKFMNLCADTLPSYSGIFDQCSRGERHPSHASRILSDLYTQYPILSKTNFRFDCIDTETGVEYEQPYFTAHPQEFKGKIL